MGSRNLNAQAKLLITQPSQSDFNYQEGGAGGAEIHMMSPSMLSGNDRYSRRQGHNNMTLPALSSPRAAFEDSHILSVRNR